MDKKDWRIIELLDQNSRMPVSELSKKISLSKQATADKLEKLKEQNKIITNFFTIVDYFKIGFQNINLLISLDGIENKELEECLKEIAKFRAVRWIAGFFGEYDVGISIFYKSIDEAKEIMNKLQEFLGRKIKKLDTYMIVNNTLFSFNFNHLERKIFEIDSRFKKIHVLSKCENKLIQLIERNPRIKYTVLAKQLDLSPNAVKYNLKKLEKDRVLIGYKLLIDFNKIGLQWGYCIFDCLYSENYKELLSELKNDKRVIMISRTVSNNLIIDFLYKDITELKDFLHAYKEKYICIYNAKLMNILKLYKLDSYFYQV